VTPAYVDGLNNPEVSQFLEGPRKQWQTSEIVRSYVAKNWLDERAVLFGIYIDGALRGTVRLYDISDVGQAVIGIALFDTNYRNRGWGNRCIRRIANYAIAELGLRRIVAASYSRNVGAIKSFKTAGFVPTPECDYPADDGYDLWITCAFTGA
jgi:RimJ/RimL family protein N-acetyltransferase